MADDLDWLRERFRHRCSSLAATERSWVSGPRSRREIKVQLCWTYRALKQVGVSSTYRLFKDNSRPVSQCCANF